MLCVNIYILEIVVWKCQVSICKISILLCAGSSSLSSYELQGQLFDSYHLLAPAQQQFDQGNQQSMSLILLLLL